MKSKSLILLAGAALGGSAAIASANSDDTDRAYRAELLADAQQRSSLLAAGATVTHDNGHFTFTDASGNNSMYLGLFGQIRYLANFGNNDRFGDMGDAADGDTVLGFQLSRVKLFAGGTVGSPDFEYYFQFGANGIQDTSRDDPNTGSSSIMTGGNLYLEDFWGKWNFEDGISVRMGQGRPNQGFEAMYQPWDLQAFERSIGHALFSVDRTQFLEVAYQSEDKTFDISGNINDGARTANQNFTSANEADVGLGGRVNWYFEGDSSDFQNQSSTTDRQDFAGRLGGGFQYETHGDTGIGTPDFDVWAANVDVEVRGASWSAGAYFYIADMDPNGGTESTHYAVRVQGGYNVTEQAELYAFWDGLFLDSDVLPSGAEDTFNFVGVGVNFYPIADSRAVQIGGEVVISLDDTSDLFGSLSDITLEQNNDFSLYNLLGDQDNEVGVGFELSVLD